MTEGSRIACYDDLVAVLRARKDELNLSDQLVDDIAGLAPGHTGKVLGPEPRERRIGPDTLWALLTAFGAVLIMVPDPDLLAEMQPYYEGRKRRFVRTRHKPRDRTVIRVMRQLGRQSAAKQRANGSLIENMRNAGKARQAKLTPEQRREIGEKLLAARIAKRSLCKSAKI